MKLSLRKEAGLKLDVTLFIAEQNAATGNGFYNVTLKALFFCIFALCLGGYI